MAGREGSRCPFAMDTEPAALSVQHMVLSFGDVVADVIDEGKAELLRADIENLQERFFRSVHDDLPVHPGIVCSRSHCGQIMLSLSGFYRRAGQLAVWKMNVVFGHRLIHDFERVLTDLITQAA